MMQTHGNWATFSLMTNGSMKKSKEKIKNVLKQMKIKV
jgi:hypothetical protein